MILSTFVSRPAKVNSLPDIQRTPLPRFHRFQISNKYLHNQQRHVVSSDGIQHFHGNNDMESPNTSCYKTNHKPISEFYFVLIKTNAFCFSFVKCVCSLEAMKILTQRHVPNMNSDKNGKETQETHTIPVEYKLSRSSKIRQTIQI